MDGHSTFEQFNRDVAENTGYLYTTDARLSSWLANRRLTDATLAAVSFLDKRVIDIGCGDGTYTVELFDRGKPASIHGFDPAERAIEIARQRIIGREIAFGTHNAYDLPVATGSFDLAHLRGVLHHLDRPIDALREAFRVASWVVLIEPNGYNPMVKLLEKYSRYHRKHGEKSYQPRQLDQWIHEVGGTVVSRRWAGFVPFFCPDWFARTLKMVEPLVERLPLVRACSCAVYVQVAKRSDEHATIE